LAGRRDGYRGTKVFDAKKGSKVRNGQLTEHPSQDLGINSWLMITVVFFLT
jgi:hypothetical protein